MDSCGSSEEDGSETSAAMDTTALDNVFLQCDSLDTGLVHASTLIANIVKQIQLTTGTPDRDGCEMSDLQNDLLHIFDPDKQDSLVDIQTYRQRIMGVLDYVNQRSEVLEDEVFTNSSIERVFRTCQLTKPLSVRSLRLASPRKALFKRERGFNDESADQNSSLSHGSLLVINETDLVENGVQENLRFQLKRLVQENQELKDNLVNQEELASKLSQRLEGLEKELRSQHHQLEQKRELLEENEELKAHLVIAYEARDTLEREKEALLRNNTSLETEKHEYLDKFSLASNKLQELAKEKNNLESSLIETKKAHIEVEEMASERKLQLYLKNQELLEAKNYLDEQKQLTETLRMDKIDLELQLNRTQHDLQSVLNKTDVMDVNSSVHLTPEELVLEEEESDESCDGPFELLEAGLGVEGESMDERDFCMLLPSKQQRKNNPMAASTPFKVDSICAEISKCIREEPFLPSPLCKKEFLDVTNQGATTGLADDLARCLRALDIIIKALASQTDEVNKKDVIKRTCQAKESLQSLKGQVSEIETDLKESKNRVSKLQNELEKEKEVHAQEISSERNLLQQERDLLRQEKALVEKLNSQVSAAEESNSKRREEISSLNCEMTELLKIKENLLEKLTSVENENQELKNANKSVDTLITSLEHECSKLTRYNAGLETEMACMRKEHTEIYDENAHLETLVASLVKEEASMKKALTELETKKACLEKENIKLRDITTSFESKIVSMEQEISDVQQINLSLEAEKGNLEIEIKELKTSDKVVDTELECLRNENEKLKAINVKLKENCDSLETVKLDLEKVNGTLEEEISNCDIQIRESQETTERLLKDNAEQKGRISSFENQISEAQEANTKLIQKLTSAEIKEAELNENLMCRQENITSLKTKHEEILTANTVLEEKIVCLGIENEELKQSKFDLEEQIETAKRAAQELSDRHKLSEAEKSTLRKHYDTVNKDYTELQQRSKEFQNQLLRSRSEQESDWKELNALLTKTRHTDSHDEMDSSELLESQDIRERIATELDSLRSQLAQSQAALDSLQKEVVPRLLLNLNQQPQPHPQQHSGAGDASELNAGSPLVEALTLDDWRTTAASATQHNKTRLETNHHIDGTVSDENTLDESYALDKTFTLDNNTWCNQVQHRRSNLTRTDSSSCPDIDEEFDDLDYFKHDQYPKLGDGSGDAIGTNLYVDDNKRVSFDTTKRGFFSSSRDTLNRYSNNNNTSTHYRRSSFRKKNVLFVDQVTRSESSGSSIEALDLIMTHHGEKYRSDSYEQAIGWQHTTSNTLSPYKSRTISFKKAVESGTSGDSGISYDIPSNNSLDVDMQETLENIKNSPKLLRPSTFRSGYYDVNNIHMPSPASPIHNNNNGLNGVILNSTFGTGNFAASNFGNSPKQGRVRSPSRRLHEQNIDSLDTRQGFGDLARLNINHAAEHIINDELMLNADISDSATVDLRNKWLQHGCVTYDNGSNSYGDSTCYDERSLSPSTRRKLSILKEESLTEMEILKLTAAAEKAVLLAPPIAPPRRRGRSPRPNRPETQVRRADASPKHIKDLSNHESKKIEMNSHKRFEMGVNDCGNEIEAYRVVKGDAANTLPVKYHEHFSLSPKEMPYSENVTIHSENTNSDHRSVQALKHRFESHIPANVRNYRSPARFDCDNSFHDEVHSEDPELIRVLANHKPSSSTNIQFHEPVYSQIMPSPIAAEPSILDVTEKMSQMTILTPPKIKVAPASPKSPRPPSYKLPPSYKKTMEARSRDNSPMSRCQNSGHTQIPPPTSESMTPQAPAPVMTSKVSKPLSNKRHAPAPPCNLISTTAFTPDPTNATNSTTIESQNTTPSAFKQPLSSTCKQKNVEDSCELLRHQSTQRLRNSPIKTTIPAVSSDSNCSTQSDYTTIQANVPLSEGVKSGTQQQIEQIPKSPPQLNNHNNNTDEPQAQVRQLDANTNHVGSVDDSKQARDRKEKEEENGCYACDKPICAGAKPDTSNNQPNKDSDRNTCNESNKSAIDPDDPCGKVAQSLATSNSYNKGPVTQTVIRNVASPQTSAATVKEGTENNTVLMSSGKSAKALKKDDDGISQSQTTQEKRNDLNEKSKNCEKVSENDADTSVEVGDLSMKSDTNTQCEHGAKSSGISEEGTMNPSPSACETNVALATDIKENATSANDSGTHASCGSLRDDNSESKKESDVAKEKTNPGAKGAGKGLERSCSVDEERSTSDTSQSVDNKKCTEVEATPSSLKQNSESDVTKGNCADDIKQEILEGLAKTQEGAKVAFKPAPDLAKIREEKIALKKLQKQSGMPELSENMELDSVDSKTNSDSNISESTPPLTPGGKSDVSTTKDDKESDVKSETSSVCDTQVYPSLSKNVMKKLGLFRGPGQDVSSGSMDLNEKDIEDKFTNVTLAFKTDKLTLDQRLLVHQRARDTIEQNIDVELKGLKTALQNLSPMCNDMKSRELFCLIERHIEILEHSHCRLASRAEIHGAVQQEARISKAIDVMVRHVDNLKRMYEREHQELEETRRLLQENRLIGGDSTQALPKALSSGGGAKLLLKDWVSKRAGTRRRASLAVLPRASLSNLNLTPPSRDLIQDKGRFQNLLDTTTNSVSSAFRRASLIARRASFGVPGSGSASPPSNMPSNCSSASTTPQSAPVIERVSHQGPIFGTTSARPRFSRMSSQASSISSDDVSSPRQSLSVAIPEDDDILEEVPMRYPGNGKLSDPHLQLNDKSIENNTNNKKGDDDNKKNEDSHDKKTSSICDNTGDNSDEKNNNEASSSDLEERKAKERARRAIANQTIITDDDPEDVTEDESSRLSMPRTSDGDMVQQALLFQEQLRDLIERQDTLEDDDECQESRLERLWQRVPDWKTFKLRMRYTLGGLLFLLGVMCLLATFIPSGARVEANDHLSGVQGWNSVQDALWPFLTVESINKHPY